MPKFFIQPTNEGQELNYVETFKGTRKQAKERADKMKKKLKKILSQGTIDVEIEQLKREAQEWGLYDK